MGAVRTQNATPRRLKIYDLAFGAEATPADAVALWQAVRIDSTDGTASTAALSPLDLADAASTSSGHENFTVDPTTLGGILLSIPLNQRASFRWVAAPGSELVTPATAERGLGLDTPTNTISGNETATILFEE
jgi:hypothetical protein